MFAKPKKSEGDADKKPSWLSRSASQAKKHQSLVSLHVASSCVFDTPLRCPERNVSSWVVEPARASFDLNEGVDGGCGEAEHVFRGCQLSSASTNNRAHVC